MPRVNVYLSESILRELRIHVINRYGVHKGLSLTVEQAIKEFLTRANLPPHLQHTAVERREMRRKYAGKERKDGKCRSAQV